MVRGNLRSRTYRRVHVRVPSGKSVLRFKKRKPKGQRCAQCKAQLKGTPRERPSILRSLPKSQKRPERPFGGMLCSACTRKIMVARARRMALK